MYSGTLRGFTYEDAWTNPAAFDTLQEFIDASRIKHESICNKINRTPNKKKEYVLVVPVEKTKITKNFLLIQQPANHSIHPEMLNFPGGKPETGETILQTACREFLEETGLDLQAPKQVGAIAPCYGDYFHGKGDYLVHIVSGTPFFSIKGSMKSRAMQGQRKEDGNGLDLKTFYGTANSMLSRHCVPNIPLIAALCSQQVCPFVLEDGTGHNISPNSYSGNVTLYRNIKVSYEPGETPRPISFATIPPSG